MVRKFCFSLFIVFAIVFELSHIINAQVVSIDEARHVAEYLILEKSQLQNKSILNEAEYKEEGQVYYYIFNIEDGRFIIVSAEKKTFPVLAYNLSGSIIQNSHSPAFENWMQMYVTQIKYARDNNIKQENNIVNEWQKYQADFSELENNKDNKAIIGPLFGPDGNTSSISYNQSGFYNDDCPGGSLTGCVATAMSQIIVYHDHPNFGVGYREYDHSVANGFSNDFGLLTADYKNTIYNTASLPPNITSANADVAQLCYHAGVSVLMDYDVGASGSSLRDASNSMLINWNYKKDLEYRYKDLHTGVNEWENMIRANIDAGLPLLYMGVDNGGFGGHAWVCDGYDDSNNMFHMNWGWGGSNNGFFLLSALNPGTYNFIDSQAAIFGLTPNTTDTLTIMWEDFDVDDNYFYLTPGWDTDADGDTKNWGGATGGYNSFAKIGNGGEIDQWLVSPKMGFPTGYNITMSLYTSRLNNNNQEIEVYISTTGTNISTDFNIIDSLILTDTWANHTIDLSAYAGQNVYLGLKATGSESGGVSYCYIDDLLISATPTVPSALPIVTTDAVSNISYTTAKGNGNIIDLGIPNPTSHGFCWSITGTPTIADPKTDEGSVAVTGTFSSTITGLNANTTYYLRAYATNLAGTSYGSTETFSTLNCNQPNAQWAQIGDDIDGEAEWDWSGRSIGMNGDGTIVAIGAFYNNGNGNNSGHVRVFEEMYGNWTQIGTDIDGEAAGDSSGFSVSLNLSGSIIAIGAPNNDGNGSRSGHVRVFEYIGSDWIQLGNDIDGEYAGEESGWSVDLNSDGTIVAIGAVRNDTYANDAGAVRVFEYVGGNWQQIGNELYGEAIGDVFGNAVSLNSDGTILAAGAQWNDGNGYHSGNTRIYEYDGINWIQKGNDIDGENSDDNSGYTVDIDAYGNIVAIGAPGNNGNGSNSGHVRIFEYNGINWIQMGNDIDGENSHDMSGYSVSISSNGSIVATTSIWSDNNGIDAGQARAFRFCGGNWIQVGNDIDGVVSDDQFGNAVRISSDGSVIAASSMRNNGGGSRTGHTRIFHICTQTYSNITDTACLSYISPSGNYTWTNSGVYNDTLINYEGCDSIITINLTINNTYATNNVTLCDSIDYISPSGNYIWTNTGTYNDTIINSLGCDSIITINLTFNSIDTSISQNGDTLFVNAGGATYQWLNCDSSFAPVSGATDQSIIAPYSGNFAVVITQNTCTDTSSCYYVNLVKILESEDIGVLIYPNPSTGKTIIQAERVSRIEAINTQGKLVFSQKIKDQDERYIVDLSNQAKGIYFIKVTTNRGVSVGKVVLE